MKGSFKKAATAFMVTAMFTLTGSIASHADKIPVQIGSYFNSNLYNAWLQTESGQASQPTWVQQQNIWYYLNGNGEVQTGWLNKDGCWYYLNAGGAMQTNWMKENDNWYYLGENGTMFTGWFYEDGNWYYLNTDGKMITGWLNENGSWYYLNPDGKMTTGWLNESDSWYYLDPDGKMCSGWQRQGSDWYYLNSDGKMATGWLNLNDALYYLNSDGKMATGWLEQDGDWYYLNSDGKAACDWLNLNGVWYYLYDNGRMAVNAWIGLNYVDANGVWIENQVPNQSTDSFVSEDNKEESTESTNNTESADNTESTDNMESVDNTESADNTEFVDNTESVENVPDHMGSEITPEYIMQQLENLKVKYPDGMYWNHMGYTAKRKDTNYYSETVTSIPCNHGQYGTDYCNSYINYSLAYVIGMQCDGFARKLSDEIFGTDAKKTDYTYSFDAVKVGDYLRYNNVHTVLVVGKDENGIQVAECNIGGTCVIRWGRRITRSDLDQSRSVTCFTRY